MKLPRRTYFYKPKKKPSDQALIERMEQLALPFNELLFHLDFLILKRKSRLYPLIIL